MTKTKTIKRGANGLISQPKVDYIFTEEGMIDWRKMVKPEFLAPNRQKTKETDVSKIEDKDLLILLGGIKNLAHLRGYTNVSYNVCTPHPSYVVATCSITWTPNYETEGQEVSFSAIADASLENTSSFGKLFLAAIAENRSFVRCVRNFLRINIVGQDEVPGGFKFTEETPSTSNQTSPHFLLEAVMKEKTLSFEIVKNKLIKESFPNAETFENVSDIPKSKVFELIDRIKKVSK